MLTIYIYIYIYIYLSICIYIYIYIYIARTVGNQTLNKTINLVILAALQCKLIGYF